LEAFYVAVEAFDGVFVAVAPAAVEQDGFVGGPDSDLGGE
jgi:hypothetical protein